MNQHSPAFSGWRSKRNLLARAAFSLIEVVLALGIVSIALISIVSLIPIGLSALQGSVDDTVTSLILQDVKGRMSALPFANNTPVPVYYYDAKGAFVDTKPSEVDPLAYFRVDVAVATPYQVPAYSNLLAACVTMTWPVLNTGSASPSSKNQVKISFYTSPLTAPGWKVVDPNFEPKMDL